MSSFTKITGFVLFFFIFSVSLILLVPQTVFSAETAISCWVTNFGNPPADFKIPEECSSGGGPMAQKAVELARAQIGKPYVWASPFGRPWASLDPSAGKTPSAFDCSGLTGWAWYWASGGKVNMNGQTWFDWSDSAGNGSTRYQKFTASQKDQVQPGDLLFWQAPGLTNGQVHHTAIYSGPCKKSSGNDCFIEAQCTQCGIVESHLSNRLGGNDPFAGFLRPVLQ